MKEKVDQNHPNGSNRKGLDNMDFLARKLEEKKIDLEFEEGYRYTFGEKLISVKQALT